VSGPDDPTPFHPTPSGDPEVSDAVLDELLAAFGLDDSDGGPRPNNVVELRPGSGAAAAEEPPGGTGAPGEPAAPTGEVTAVGDGAAPAAAAARPVPRTTIVIGGDDELPDAVYLDAEGEERLRSVHGHVDDSDERSTIVIGDELDASGVFDAITVAPSSSMDPRVRARRIAVRRAAGRRRLLWVVLAIVVVTAIAGLVAVFASSLFAVRSVAVEGNTYTDATLLDRVVDELKGTPVLLVDTHKLELELETDPWVERAEVTTHFPHGARIDIRERRALATFAGSDGRYRVIDIDGRVLSVIDGRPVAYMLLTGAAPDVDPGGSAGPPYADAAKLVSALPAELRSITTSVGVDAATGNLTIELRRADGRAVAVRIGTADQLESKLARVVQQVRQGIDDLVAIDASTDGLSVTKG
jgi:cell division protein FtsQ